MDSVMCKIEVREVPADAKEYIVCELIADSVGSELYYIDSFNTISAATDFIVDNIDAHNLIFTYGRA